MEKELRNDRMAVERWKQACKAGSNQSNYRRERGLTETRDDFFVDGVQWADEDPTMPSYEEWRNQMLGGLYPSDWDKFIVR